MTDHQRKKTEFGADREADKVLMKLPRVNSSSLIDKGKVALVALDDSGRLLIAIDGGGLLSINERDLAYIHGDEVYEV